MTKNEMKAFIETLQAEKQAMAEQIQALQAKPEKAKKAEKTRKPRRAKVQASQPLENKIVSFDAKGKAKTVYAAPYLPFVSADVDALAQGFAEWLLATRGKKSSQIKAFKNRKVLNGCKAMFSLFAEYSKNGKILNDGEIAVQWPATDTGSFAKHAQKVRDYLETLK